MAVMYDIVYNMNIVRTRICKKSSPDIGVVRGDVINGSLSTML